MLPGSHNSESYVTDLQTCVVGQSFQQFVCSFEKRALSNRRQVIFSHLDSPKMKNPARGRAFRGLIQRARLSAAPPGDPIFASCIRKPQEQIAMARHRSAKAHQIASAQFIERPQQFVLIAQPGFMLCDDGCTITVCANPEWIAPFAAAADINCAGWHACLMLVENLAHA